MNEQKAVIGSNGKKTTTPFYDENGWAYIQTHDDVSDTFIRVHALTDKPRAIKIFKKIFDVLEAEFNCNERL